MIFERKKIVKNNNAENEFLWINTHHNMIFRKQIFCKLQRRHHFSELSKKSLTIRPKKTGLRFLIYSKKIIFWKKNF